MNTDQATDFSPQQVQALTMVKRWTEQDAAQTFRLFGFAGTGKTTIARHLAGDVAGGVLFASFTGKAAHVMRLKGCHGASTIHQLIYIPHTKSEAKLAKLDEEFNELAAESKAADYADASVNDRMEELKNKIEKEIENMARPSFSLNFDSELKEAMLLIIDECSMVDRKMADDLLSFGTKILALGDPAQLPPIGSPGFFTGGDPDMMLTEVHRQALDSPVLAMATDVRKGGRLRLGNCGESRILNSWTVTTADMLEADQILCGKNATRHQLNREVRRALGRDEVLPLPGDKLVCLKNNHELGLFNGSLWKVVTATPGDHDRVRLTLDSADVEGAPLIECFAFTQHFEGRGEEFKRMPWFKKTTAEEFDYGYALTTHKAQGSQWNNVLIYNESKVFRKDASRWLYTAITRAAEKVTIVQ